MATTNRPFFVLAVVILTRTSLAVVLQPQAVNKTLAQQAHAQPKLLNQTSAPPKVLNQAHTLEKGNRNAQKHLRAAGTDVSSSSAVVSVSSSLTIMSNSSAEQSPCYAYSAGTCNRACCQCRETRQEAPATERALGRKYLCCFSYFQSGQCSAGTVVVGSGIATPCPGNSVGINCWDARF
mmetsp:Transcript_137532/g.439449  ORF Transcript_137532/g.439449 Transcript_137532/m.439449 type:complete len:180 (-) Transcript_137532:119-658(-)